MPLPRLPALLAELDATTHAARCRRIVDLARANRDNASLASLMDGLAAHSDYHALLTVSAAAAISIGWRCRSFSQVFGPTMPSGTRSAAR